MQVTISLHHIFPHSFPDTEHGRNKAQNMIFLAKIHLSLNIKISSIVVDNTFIKRGKEDDLLHNRVRRK